MKNGQNYGGIDRFRMVAALLIVGIHTAPLASINGELDFLVFHVIGRIAVPFFLMATGFFLMPQYLSQEKQSTKPLISFVKKTGILYAVATLLYLPFSIYAGYYAEGSIVVSVLRNVFFDGTFYHLWYLPAAIVGVLLVYILGRKLPFRVVLILSGLLYILGLLGDSYYGIVAGVPFLNVGYNVAFTVFSYTRNGVFYAPLFIAMGALIAKAKRPSAKVSMAGFALSTMFMLAEGFLLKLYDFQRHDSMYVALVPCMYFLFQLLLAQKGKASQLLRDTSLWVYLLHPLFIIAVRGMAKFTKFTGLLVENSLIHYLVVCVLSVAFAVFIALIKQKKKPPIFHKGRAWVELDMEDLRYNVGVLQSRLPDSCQLMPAIKANAYGHGAAQIAKELNSCGIRAFCVASVLEGVELRKSRIKGDILIMGYTHPKQFCLLKKHRLTQSVIDYNYATTLNDYGKKISVHVKVDTGMHRLGERSENIYKILKIFGCKNLAVTGIYTHLCAGDSEQSASKEFTKAQVNNFCQVLATIKEQGLACPKVHILSSYGVFNHPELAHDYARVGISLYGMLSTREDTQKCGAGLKAVLSLKAHVSAVKTLYAGEALGYGLAFVAPYNMQIAVLSIGYADGIPRGLSGGVGSVLIGGQKTPILGRICMDQMMVDITGADNVKQGDVSVIIGKCGNEEITACEMAEQAGTIANEILSRLGSRLEKVVCNSTKR